MSGYTAFHSHNIVVVRASKENNGQCMLNIPEDQTYEWEVLRLPDVVIIYCDEDDPNRPMLSCYADLEDLTYMQRI